MNKSVFYSLLVSLPMLAACTQTNAINTAATPEPTSTPPINQPAKPDHDTLQRMAYAADQIQSIESGVFKAQEDMLIAWWQYWANANEDARPFGSDPDPTFAYYWNEDGTPGGVLLRPGGSFGKRTFYVPIQHMEYLKETPVGSEVHGYSIPTGMGPLEISGDEYILAWVGNWARLDESGRVAQTVNMGTAQWEDMPMIQTDIISMKGGWPRISNNVLSSGALARNERIEYEGNRALQFSVEVVTASSYALQEDFNIGQPLEQIALLGFSKDLDSSFWLYGSNKAARPVKIFSVGDYIYPSEERRMNRMGPSRETDLYFEDGTYISLTEYNLAYMFANKALITELWLNPSGRISYLHFVTYNATTNETGTRPDPTDVTEMIEDDRILVPVAGCKNCGSVCSVKSNYENLPLIIAIDPQDLCDWYNEIGFESIDKYMREWVETGEIPEELEKIPLFGEWARW
ncbi:hypothetical protein KKA08_06060 [bacterium]|nr:hypothetical protein [bacterium]